MSAYSASWADALSDAHGLARRVEKQTACREAMPWDDMWQECKTSDAA